MIAQDEIDQIVAEAKKQKLLADYRAGKKITMPSSHTGVLSKN